jgi:hypothetical protein
LKRLALPLLASLVLIPLGSAAGASVVRSGKYVGKAKNSHKRVEVDVRRRTVRVKGGWEAFCRSTTKISGSTTTKPTKRRNDSVLSGEKPKDKRHVYFDAKGTVNGKSSDGRSVRVKYDGFGGPISRKKVDGGWYVHVFVLGAGGAVTDECASDAAIDPQTGWYTLGGGDGYVARRR